jgi:hypothetical protein
MKLKTIIHWLAFNDYDIEKDRASARIISRQSRGSVAAQNGWYMSAKRLEEQSKKADAEIVFLDKTLLNI